MAKFDRFDPRNKKRGNHKSQTLYKDCRIREDQKRHLKDNDVDIKHPIDEQLLENVECDFVDTLNTFTTRD